MATGHIEVMLLIINFITVQHKRMDAEAQLWHFTLFNDENNAGNCA